MVSSDKSKRLRREIVALCFLFLALFVGCCLVSYNCADTSFNTASSETREVANWGGVVGSYLADGLFQLFGLSAFLLPLTLLWVAWRLFLPAGLKVRYSAVVSSVFLVISLSVMCSLLWGDGTITMASFAYELNGGGFVGRKIGALSLTYLNRLGSIIVFTSLFLISLILVTNLSLLKIAHGFQKVYSWLVRGYRVFKGLIFKLSEVVQRLYAWIIRFASALKRLYGQWKLKLVQKPEGAAIQEIEQTFTHSEETSERPARKKRVTKSQPELPLAPFASSKYKSPPLSLLDSYSQKVSKAGKEALKTNSKVLENKLGDFGVQGKVVDIHPGPVVTRYEFEPASGIRISKILNLADDLALALKALGVRILAPVPGKAVVGIEIPNEERETVYFREIVEKETFLRSQSRLTLALGKDIAGKAIISDLAKMPHLLIAGSTGSGKSVLINVMICSILYKATPSEVKMLLIDPKRLELSFYEGIPHLLHPVVTDPKKAALALQWTVGEMERRYQMLAEKGVRDINGYNQVIAAELRSRVPREEGREDEDQPTPEPLPYILVVIDELADLMMVSSREVEISIARLAQMARAAGIHLLVATQRPSVDVLTGTIKVNFSARISFQVSSKIDSRTIIDTAGAERLLGLGDMLFLPPGTSKLVRVHGSYLKESEIRRITAFLKKQGAPVYNQSVLEMKQESPVDDTDDYDERYDDAVALVAQTRTASISMIQRRLRIGYNRAARIIERMEREKVVGPSDGVKPREVLIKPL